MALKLTKLPVLRVATTRGLASSKSIPISGTADYTVSESSASNGLLVVSAENCSPLTRVSVLFKAGARYEEYDTLGVTHVLRIAAGLTTRNATQFSITRQIQQVGANLTCSTDREVITYTLEGTRDAVQEVLPFLGEVSTQQVFRPWELSDNQHRLKIELKTRPYELRAIDMLHKAAFRETGLGNSLFISKKKIGKISCETLQHYCCQTFTSDRGAIAGVGIDHKDLVKFASGLKVNSGGGAKALKSVYKGGEARLERGGNLTYIALGKEGGLLSPGEDVLSFAILQHIIGTGPSIPYGNESKGLLSQCMLKSVPTACVQTINANYSDSGIFGALVCVPADQAGNAVAKSVEVLNCVEISDADVQRGKLQLIRSLLSSLESGSNVVENLGVQALFSCNILDAVGIAAAIKNVPTSKVKDALGKVRSSKLSIASVGNLKNVPYLDEI